MSVKRYYAQCIDTGLEFQSRWERAWQVFDRERLGPGGDVWPVALCINRAAAFQIRDALNALEEASKPPRKAARNVIRVLRG